MGMGHSVQPWVPAIHRPADVTWVGDTHGDLGAWRDGDLTARVEFDLRLAERVVQRGGEFGSIFAPGCRRSPCQ